MTKHLTDCLNDRLTVWRMIWRAAYDSECNYAHWMRLCVAQTAAESHKYPPAHTSASGNYKTFA